MFPVRKLERQSVQEFEPPDNIAYNSIWWDELSRDGTLPAWGLHKRDRALRTLYRNSYNWMAQSAVSALVRKVKSTPWQLKAGRNTASHFQEVLQQAHFGRGWGEFVSRLLLDFLTCDYGAYIEVIGRGKPDSALKGRVTGLAVLDSLRCVPTGNLEYPVVYYSRKTNTLHRLHHTRVIRIVDMPDGDESRHLAGLCSLSRAVSIIEQQIPLQRYLSGTFDDMPPIGIFYNNANMNDEQWKKAWAAYKQSLKQNKSGILTLNNGQAGSEVTGEFLRFASSPDGFNYETYTEIAVNATAAAFGIDRQDIYPLTGKMSGTATQSEVLSEKAHGMAYGDILSILERSLNNHILPANAEFNFEYKDPEKDIQIAQRDQVIVNTVQSLNALSLPPEAVMQYLVNMSDTFRDAFTDEDGELLELPDDDLKPNTQPAPPPEMDEDATVDDNLAETDEDSAVQGESKSLKAIQATRLDFENRFDDILEGIRDGSVTRRRAGILLRGLIRTFGSRAYRDGLQDGGVDIAEIDSSDERTINQLIMKQSQYVSNLTATLIHGNGISDLQAQQKAELWFNKSISPFYDAGRLSADKNGMYLWTLGATEQHCKDCKRLDTQVHRLRSYLEKGWYPRSDKLECTGFHCDCRLLPTDAPAKGRF